jgi:hypothetical protein
MSEKKDSVDGFVWVKFQEHPIIDFKKRPAKLFDVTSEGHTDFSSDFIIHGNFDHGQYCMCLIETAFGLPDNQLSSFLDYQCAQLKIPDGWLIHFEIILYCNQGLIKSFQKKVDLLIRLLEDKRGLHSGYGRQKQLIFQFGIPKEKDERFDIIKVKEELEIIADPKDKEIFLHRCKADYLQEVEDNEEAKFIRCICREFNFLEIYATLEKAKIEVDKGAEEAKKITFKGTPTQLADLIGQFKEIRDMEGDLVFDGSTMDYVRFICNTFCKSDGSKSMENSIRKYLTSYRNGKRSSKKNQIDISEIGLLED